MNRKRKKSPFEKPGSASLKYARAMRHIAKEIGRIIRAFPVGDPRAVPALKDALRKYSEVLRPWAKLQAAEIVNVIDRQDARAWAAASQQMSKALREELRATPTGAAVRERMQEQVRLITSLPIEAGERVHKLTINALENSGRAEQIKKEILRSGEVTAVRATLIARTEVARTASVLTQVRAEHIGSDGYIWRTARDEDVRESHRKMEGRFVAWNEAPMLDGMVGHAGTLPNCRCYPEPVIPENIE